MPKYGFNISKPPNNGLIFFHKVKTENPLTSGTDGMVGGVANNKIPCNTVQCNIVTKDAVQYIITVYDVVKCYKI